MAENISNSTDKQASRNEKDSLKSLKGMFDVLPDKVNTWQYLEDKIRQLMAIYGYDEIRFPILERAGLFRRSIGEVTDIVEKEMFSFQDKDKFQTLLSMRPEGTASTVRSCIEHGLIRNQQQQRLWYMGPMFRRENPQKGRSRQFNQLGVEGFGFKDIKIEVEHLLMMHNLWKKIGIASEVSLEISSLGNNKSRSSYTNTLQAYFIQHKKSLDEDSGRRLSKNPLRILDSKNPDMQDLIANAPNILEHIDSESKQSFEELQAYLHELDISFTINPKIVRGLDYYNGTVYEWTTPKLGAQSTICAGGRYDSLSGLLGGPEAFATGFALGIDRVLLLMSEMGIKVGKNLSAYLIAVGDVAGAKSIAIADKLRNIIPNLSLMVNIGGGSFKTQFKRADKSQAKIALILGAEELENNQIGIKFLREEREQMNVAMEDLADILGEYCGHISN